MNNLTSNLIFEERPQGLVLVSDQHSSCSCCGDADHLIYTLLHVIGAFTRLQCYYDFSSI